VESFVQWRPSDGVSLRADYTYVRAWDDIADQALLRRPRHKASLDAEWRPASRLALSGTLLYVGPWIDGNRDFTIARLKAPGYVTANLAATWQASKRWALFGRITNLLDRRYQDPIGFLAPGRGVFVGVRASL
jgi:vitamin B12 transporter